MENTQRRIRQNGNFALNISGMLLEIWEEIHG
jgi:hypothetical protein